MCMCVYARARMLCADARLPLAILRSMSGDRTGRGRCQQRRRRSREAPRLQCECTRGRHTDPSRAASVFLFAPPLGGRSDDRVHGTLNRERAMNWGRERGDDCFGPAANPHRPAPPQQASDVSGPATDAMAVRRPNTQPGHHHTGHNSPRTMSLLQESALIFVVPGLSPHDPPKK